MSVPSCDETMSGAKHKGVNYWTLYYLGTEELAMCMRSTTAACDISQLVLRKILNEMVRKGLIRDELPLARTQDVSYWEGWELSRSFNLCPCIEIWRKTYHYIDGVVPETHKWRWKRII